MRLSASVAEMVTLGLRQYPRLVELGQVLIERRLHGGQLQAIDRALAQELAGAREDDRQDLRHAALADQVEVVARVGRGGQLALAG